jgi:hypothetical protein
MKNHTSHHTPPLAALTLLIAWAPLAQAGFFAHAEASADLATGSQRAAARIDNSATAHGRTVMASSSAWNTGMRAVLERSSQPVQRRDPGAAPLVDAQAQRFTSPLVRVIAHGDFDPNENEWRNSSRERVPVNTGQTYVRALQCNYRGSDSMGRSVTLWEGQRPPLTAENPLRPNGSNFKTTVTADVAVSACPRTWGDALVAVWGPTAWTDLKNSSEAKSSLARTTALQAAFAAQRQAAWEALPEWERCYRTNFGDPNDYYLEYTDSNLAQGKVNLALIASIHRVCGKP